MKHRQKTAWFLSGVLATVLASLMIFPALALYTKNVQIHPGVKIYVDDETFMPKDYDGNPLEAFIYNDTTYLPVRAVSDALDVPIQWDNDTQSVYIGKHIGDKPIVWLKDMDYFSGDTSISWEQSEQDNMGGTHHNCIIEDFSRTYLVNKKYSVLSGTIYQRYKYRSKTDIAFTLKIYGDGGLIYENEYVGEEFKPADFSVDLTNVSKLKVEYETGSFVQYNPSSTRYDSEGFFALGDVGLWA